MIKVLSHRFRIHRSTVSVINSRGRPPGNHQVPASLVNSRFERSSQQEPNRMTLVWGGGECFDRRKLIGPARRITALPSLTGRLIFFDQFCGLLKGCKPGCVVGTHGGARLVEWADEGSYRCRAEIPPLAQRTTQ